MQISISNVVFGSNESARKLSCQSCQHDNIYARFFYEFTILKSFAFAIRCRDFPTFPRSRIFARIHPNLHLFFLFLRFILHFRENTSIRDLLVFIPSECWSKLIIRYLINADALGRKSAVDCAISPPVIYYRSPRFVLL